MLFCILIGRRWVVWGRNCRNLVGNSATSRMVEGEVGSLPLVSNFWELSFSLKKAMPKSGVFQERRGGGYYEVNLVWAACYVHKRPDCEYLAARDQITKGNRFSQLTCRSSPHPPSNSISRKKKKLEGF